MLSSPCSYWGGYVGSAPAANLSTNFADNKAKTANIAKLDEEGEQPYCDIAVGSGDDKTILPTFEEAINQANINKEKITLLTDAEDSEKYTRHLEGCNEIDLNGNTLTLHGQLVLDKNKCSETVVISDSKGGGKIVFDFAQINISDHMFANNASATLIIKGGTFEKKVKEGRYYGGIYVGKNDNSKLVIYDGTFNCGDYTYPFGMGQIENSGKYYNGTIEIKGGKFVNSKENRLSDYVSDPYKVITADDGTCRVVPSDKITLNYGDDNAEYLKTFEKGLLIDTNESNEDYNKWLSKMTIGEDLANVDVTLKRNFVDGKWNPLYLPYAITATADMLAAFDVAEIWDTELVDGATTLEFKTLKEGESIPSYTPFIVKPRNGSTEFTATATTIEATAKSESECSTIKQKFTFYGVLENTKLNENHGYYLDAANNAMMFATNTSKYIPPFKFYMTIQDKATGEYVVPAAQQSRVAIRIIGDETNGINSINDNREKMNDNRVFNMQGIMVGTSTMGLPKGMYVQNGRKVMVK